MNNLSVVVSLITEDNDYQLEQAASAQATALKLGIDLQIIYANSDAVQQTQQILSFIQEPAKRPDAILVEPVGTGMLQVAKAAVSAGIGWIVMNASVDYLSQLRQHAMVPIFAVASDNEQIGKIQGQQIEAILGNSGCVLSIEGPAVGDVARNRAKGMMSTKPAGVTVKTLKGNWTQQSGYQAVRSWLALSTSREMHIGMVVCQNDDMAFGARRAFEELTEMKERDTWTRLPITGCDGVAKAGQSWVKQGRLAATVYSPALTGEALQLLSAAHKGGNQPPERTLLVPASIPALSELKRARAASAGKTD